MSPQRGTRNTRRQKNFEWELGTGPEYEVQASVLLGRGEFSVTYKNNSTIDPLAMTGGVIGLRSYKSFFISAFDCFILVVTTIARLGCANCSFKWEVRSSLFSELTKGVYLDCSLSPPQPPAEIFDQNSLQVLCSLGLLLKIQSNFIKPRPRSRYLVGVRTPHMFFATPRP